MKADTLPLYRQLAEQIRLRYVEGKPPGTRLPTVRELEELHEVSFATVRSALKALETTGAIERRQGSGTYVRGQRTTGEHVAILLEADISDQRLSPFYTRLLQEVRLALFRQGIPSRPYLGYLRVDLEIGELTCREFFDELHAERISGVISLFAKAHRTWNPELAKRGIPVIGERGGARHQVTVDPEKVAQAVLERFRSLGRRRLAVVGLRKEVPNSMTEAILRKAASFGLEVERHAISLYSPERQARQWQALRLAFRRREGAPEAVFITDDMLFEGWVRTMGDLPPLSPAEIVVYASDAVALSAPFGFTRCLYSTRLKAQRIVDAMKRSLGGEALPDLIEVPFTLTDSLPSLTEEMAKEGPLPA